MPRERKVGPSGPIAGLAAEIETARRNKLQGADLARVLAEYRDGVPGAADRLRAGLVYLVYERSSTGHQMAAHFVGLTVAINRLSTTEKGRNVDAASVPRFVTDEMVRRRRKAWREDDFAVRPKPSTNAKRRKKGQEPYEALHKVPESPPPSGDDTAPLYDRPSDAAINTPIGDRHRPDAQLTTPSADDLRASLCRSDDELEVLRLLAAGYSYRRAACTLAARGSKAFSECGDLFDGEAEFGMEGAG